MAHSLKRGIVFVALSLLILNVGCSSDNDNADDETPKKTEETMAETFDQLKEGLGNKNLKTEDISFNLNGKKHLATYVVNADQDGVRPAIIVIPEWWGLNDYVKERAKMLASIGYAAMAIDPFGNGDIAANPTEAMAFTKPYYDDPSLVNQLIEAAMQVLKSQSDVDTGKIGTVGYCFGGYVSLSAGVANLGLKTAVGFHPSLGGVKPAGASATKLLICHGADDDFEKDNVAPFEQRMKDAGIDYTFKSYPGSKHAFTNPEATAKGEEFNIPTRYNEDADKNSWGDMKRFLAENLK